MEKILHIVSLISIFFFAIANVKYDLHMMQLNSYKNDRFRKWLKGNFVKDLKWMELFVILMVLLGFLLHRLNFAFTVCILTLALITHRKLTKPAKKKLVFTKRATRLFILTFVLWLALFVVSIIHLDNYFYEFFITLFSVFFSFIFMIIANFFLKPVEKSINNRFYNDAKRILKNMPDLKVIGITGSYGKTSTKHFLHAILSQQFNTLMTPGSYNTTMGVVRTIRENLKPIHQVFIAEMGAKQEGDIKEICDLVNPDIGILTSIGEAHLESFKTVENIQKTKFELVDSISDTGFVVLNADSKLIKEHKQKENTTHYYYGVKTHDADYFASDIKYSSSGMEFKVFEGEKEILNLKTKLLGEHNIANILASVVIGLQLKISKEKITFAVKQLKPVSHRLEIKRNQGGITVIDDAFNSNPQGAKMALDVLDKIEGNKKIILTPGMIELGEKQEQLNKTFGEQIAATCDYTILVGERQTQPIAVGLESKNYPKEKYFVAKNFKEATNHLQTIVNQGDVILYENDLPDSLEA